jgi:hypothetical protein
MSGGHYDYKYHHLDDLADEMENEIKRENRWEPITHIAEREYVIKKLRELAKICHDIEWIDSSDYGEKDWKPITDFMINGLIK